MQEKVAAWKETVRIKGKIDTGQEEMELIFLIRAISEELTINPEIYSDGRQNMWIYYPQSQFDCHTIFEEYGMAAAVISEKYPVSFLGTAGTLEEVSLQTRILEDRKHIQIEKYNISGKDFDLIASLCVKINWRDKDTLQEFVSIFGHLNCWHKVLPVRRTQYLEHIFTNLPQLCEDTYYRYICLDETADMADAIRSLTVGQIMKLWSLFLDDRISPPEFHYVLEAIEEGEPLQPFSWRLALSLSLEHSQIQVRYDKEGFHITDSNQTEIAYNYEDGTDAQKLFLKLLFPVSGRLV